MVGVLGGMFTLLSLSHLRVRWPLPGWTGCILR